MAPMRRTAWVFLALGLVSCDRADQKAPVLEPKNPERARTDAAPEPREAEATPGACPAVVVAVRKSGVWIRDPSLQGVIAPCGGEIDRSAVQLRLCSMASSLPPSCTAIEVAAETGIPYRHLIEVMDAAIAAGFPDVGISDPAGLSLQFREPADPGDAVSARCGAPPPACPPRPAATGAQLPPAQPTVPPVLPLPKDRAGLVDAVVIVVPADGTVLIAGKQVASAREASAGERIEPLYAALRALPAPASGAARTAVLQVDRDVDAKLLNRVIATAQAAGYQQLLFAVRSK